MNQQIVKLELEYGLSHVDTWHTNFILGEYGIGICYDYRNISLDGGETQEQKRIYWIPWRLIKSWTVVVTGDLQELQEKTPQ